MARNLLIGLAFFLAPFVLYALYLVIARRNPFTGASWSIGALAGLSLAGLFLSVVLFGVVAQNAGIQLSGRNATEAPTPR